MMDQSLRNKNSWSLAYSLALLNVALNRILKTNRMVGVKYNEEVGKENSVICPLIEALSLHVWQR